MKNIIIVTILSFCLGFSAKTQFLSLSDSSGSIANNQTIAEYGQPTSDMLISYMFVTNNTVANLDVKVKKVELFQAGGSMNVFCWGLCFPPNIYVSPDPLSIGPGETNNNDFHGEYYPTGTTDASLLRYVFFDENYPADSVCFNVKYSTEPASVLTQVSPTEIYQGMTAELSIQSNNTHFSFGNPPVVWLSNGSSIISAANTQVVNDLNLSATFNIPSDANETTWNLNIRSLFDELLILNDAVDILHLTSIGNNPSERYSIIPNPFSEMLYLKNTGLNSKISLQLLSMTGKVVMKKTLLIEEGITPVLDLEGITKGIYILSIYDEEFSSNHKIIIE